MGGEHGRKAKLGLVNKGLLGVPGDPALLCLEASCSGRRGVSVWLGGEYFPAHHCHPPTCSCTPSSPLLSTLGLRCLSVWQPLCLTDAGQPARGPGRG